MITALVIHAFDGFYGTTGIVDGTDIIAICDGTVIDQEIDIAKASNVETIYLAFGTYDRENEGKLDVQLLRNGVVIENWTVDYKSLVNGDYIGLDLTKPGKFSYDDDFRIRLTGHCETGNEIAIFTHESKNIKIFVDEDSILEDTQICYRLTLRNYSMRNALIVVCIIISAVLLCMVLFNMNEIIVMSFIFIIFIILYSKVYPGYMVPDELQHYLRAYEVANVSLVSEKVGDNGCGGNFLPANIEKINTNEEIEVDNTEVFTYGNTSLYSPISYLPQVVGMKAAQLFSNKVKAAFYGARIGNAICAIILCILALNIIPFGRRVLFILMMFPTSMQEMISVSPDGFTISLSFFLLAYILRLRFTEKKVRTRDIIILAVTGVTIALCKIVYVVLLLLLFMIPNRKFNSKMAAIISRLSIIGVAGILNLIWLKISAGFLVEFNPGVNPGEQVRYVLFNIFDYFKVCLRSSIEYLDYWTYQMIGDSLGPLMIRVVQFVWLSLLVLLVYEICSFYDNEVRATALDLCILMFTFLAGAALILTSLYVQSTKVGNDYIVGIQGRYFTPIIGLLLFFMILIKQRKNIEYGLDVKIKARGSYYYMLIFTCNMYAVIDVAKFCM